MTSWAGPSSPSTGSASASKSCATTAGKEAGWARTAREAWTKRVGWSVSAASVHGLLLMARPPDSSRSRPISGMPQSAGVRRTSSSVTDPMSGKI